MSMPRDSEFIGVSPYLVFSRKTLFLQYPNLYIMSDKNVSPADLAQLESHHWSATHNLKTLFNSTKQIVISGDQVRFVINPGDEDWEKLKIFLEGLANDHYAKQLEAQVAIMKTEKMGMS